MFPSYATVETPRTRPEAVPDPSPRKTTHPRFCLALNKLTLSPALTTPRLASRSSRARGCTSRKPMDVFSFSCVAPRRSPRKESPPPPPQAPQAPALRSAEDDAQDGDSDGDDDPQQDGEDGVRAEDRLPRLPPPSSFAPPSLLPPPSFLLLSKIILGLSFIGIAKPAFKFSSTTRYPPSRRAASPLRILPGLAVVGTMEWAHEHEEQVVAPEHAPPAHTRTSSGTSLATAAWGARLSSPGFADGGGTRRASALHRCEKTRLLRKDALLPKRTCFDSRAARSRAVSPGVTSSMLMSDPSRRPRLTTKTLATRTRRGSGCAGGGGGKEGKEAKSGGAESAATRARGGPCARSRSSRRS
ncbi:hypothetical protein FB451DRAFT_1431706 [Mycena latifolia]|nr:hypothetical protein FB451DRAFT_1431706 [Mycena latifolia]